jgi:hypothetical protein
LAAQYLTEIATLNDVENLFYHTVATLHASGYRNENSGALCQEWPRVPLPNSKELLLASADLGRRVAALLDAGQPVSGVTSGKIRPELKPLAVISRAGDVAQAGSLRHTRAGDVAQAGSLRHTRAGDVAQAGSLRHTRAGDVAQAGSLRHTGQLNPDAGDLAVTAGWGHAGKSGVTMPGKGKVVEREYAPEELDAIRAGAETLGLSFEQAIEHLGETSRDIYLNDVAYWQNIPARVWDYTIGGYQAIKKWLSYREHDLLGRLPTTDEAREVMNIARRIAAILLLEPALDANYQAVKRATFAWPDQDTTPSTRTRN